MIEPFEPGQVRHVDGDVISLRHLELRLRRALRARFKIFTNINSAIVDPKAFDPSRASST